MAKECFGFLLNQIGDAEEVFDMEDDQLDDINTNQEAQEDQVTRKEIWMVGNARKRWLVEKLMSKQPNKNGEKGPLPPKKATSKIKT